MGVYNISIIVILGKNNMSQNKAQKQILDARGIEIHRYRTEHPAESFKTIASKKMFLDLKGNPISAQQLYNVYMKVEKLAVNKQGLTGIDTENIINV